MLLIVLLLSGVFATLLATAMLSLTLDLVFSATRQEGNATAGLQLAAVTLPRRAQSWSPVGSKKARVIGRRRYDPHQS